MRARLSFAPVLVLLLGCGSSPLPPEAYGTFKEANNQAFSNTLDVRADGLTLFVGVALPGTVGGRPLACRGAPASGTVEATMELSLTCAGEAIPYRIEFRAAQGDWVVSEDGAAPQIFTRP